MSVGQRVGAWSAGFLAFALCVPADAQIRYSSGQNAAPIFEGWQKNADGTISMVFGYLNRNFQEELDIPIGPDNRCEPAPVDCGQPTHFLVRRQRFVFRVTLPKDWPKDRKLLWILTSKGRTDTARGGLIPEMEIDNGTIAENAGAGGVLAEGNQAPKVVKGSEPQTIALPNAATVSVSFTDDGLPKPRAKPEGAAAAAPAVPADASPEVLEALENRQPGVRIRWIQYRGAGRVTFTPPRIAPVYGKTVDMTTRVTFSAPGTYVLRAIASDSQLESSFDTTVTVR
jgi:hypothetical protein